MTASAALKDVLLMHVLYSLALKTLVLGVCSNYVQAAVTFLNTAIQ
jgi:hypothetical protein